jgi:hypothetical protein
LLAQHSLVNECARPEFPFKDALAQAIGDLVVQGVGDKAHCCVISDNYL